MSKKPNAKKEEEHAEEVALLQKALDWAKAAFAAQGHKGEVSSRIEEGEVRERIVHTAVACGADYVVMGSRGGTVLHGMLGSVSDYVVRNAPCAVIIVRNTSK